MVTVLDYIQQGGTIMYVLLTLNVIGFALMIAKFFVFVGQRKNMGTLMGLLRERVRQEEGRQLDSNTLIEKTKQELSHHTKGLERGLNTVKIIATISPLLGLLGTVVGVLIAFRVMSESGLNNPAHFARGISMALVTTVGGLLVAIPHLVGHNYLLGMLDNLEADMEKELFGRVL